ncbi:hypothetical protein [Catalinimonas niigatensis]|uniref:hypothetical protein n=1 Tax=Catalinimonas niigatensis TaxID=1397264 RepID=UPI0026666E30|nr:hypothetical protein [Catalinimonas niigatensis]WPP49530.1 hypothetical protein PZB72_22930 [Catalinimonas niigatensis]
MKAIRFAFLIPMLLIFSCEGEEALPSNTLGSEIEMSMAEYIDTDKRTLTLKFLTRKDFPCINYRIKHEVMVDHQLVNIVLEKVEAADVCLDAIGPAFAFIDLGQLTEKEYDLQIQLGESIINHGTLVVSKESYQLSLNENQGIELLNPNLNRIPSQAVWGLIKYQNEEQNKKLLGFFNEAMEIAGATDKKFAEGDYGYFQVNSEGKIIQPQEQSDINEQSFLFDFSGEDDDLQQVLQQINSNFDDVQLRFYNAQGEELRNWDFN